MHLILADDDLVCQRHLTATVAGWGFTASAVGDGNEAYELLRRSRGPCLALLDWMMPGLEGPEVCRLVRMLPQQQLVYAILLTGKSAKDEVIAGLRAGADDYITKPFDPEELFARLQVGVRVLTLQQHLTSKVEELAEALARVKQLQGLLPICSYCKNVRSDDNYWHKVEHYLAQHTELQFSHGICPRCYHDVIEPELQRMEADKGSFSRDAERSVAERV